MMDTIKFVKGNVKVIAHRGLSGLEAQNTASAFVAAGNRSYFGIETDVRRSSDGKYILIHNDTTKETGGDSLTVRNTSFQTLRSLRLLNTDGKRSRGDLMIPTLAEYIEIAKKYDKECVLELKDAFTAEQVSEIFDEIRYLGYIDRTIFISFFEKDLEYVRLKNKVQPVQFLTSGMNEKIFSLISENGYDLDIYHGAATPELIKKCHDSGILVNVWTVDSPTDAEKLVSYGVDMITTNILE